MKLPLYKEYKITEDGYRVEMRNTINPLKFPFFLSIKRKIVVRKLNYSQKWKVKNYLNKNYQYRNILHKATLDLISFRMDYLDFEEFLITPNNLFNLSLYINKIFIFPLDHIFFLRRRIIIRGKIPFFFTS